MIKKKLIFILLVLYINSINGQNQQCVKILKNYFNNQKIGIQMAIVDSSGNVQYSRGNALSEQGFSADLANVDGFKSINSVNEVCNSGKYQPFDIAKASSMFFDARSFTISKEGQVKLVTGGQVANFNLTSCNGNVLTGLCNKKLYTFQLSTTTYEEIGKKCGVQPVSTGSPTSAGSSGGSSGSSNSGGSSGSGTGGNGGGSATISIEPTNSWVDNGHSWSMYNGAIKNTGTTSLTSVVLKTTVKLKDQNSIWRLDIISSGQYAIPSYQPPLAPGQSYTFSFIAETNSNSQQFTIVKLS